MKLFGESFFFTIKIDLQTGKSYVSLKVYANFEIFPSIHPFCRWWQLTYYGVTKPPLDTRVHTHILIPHLHSREVIFYCGAKSLLYFSLSQKNVDTNSLLVSCTLISVYRKRSYPIYKLIWTIACTLTSTERYIWTTACTITITIAKTFR